MSSSVESPDAKKAVFRRRVELYALGDLAALDDLIAPDYVGHTANGDRDLGAFKESITHFHEMFVYDAGSFIIEDQLADGEKVATRMTAHVKMRQTGAPVTCSASTSPGSSMAGLPKNGTGGNRWTCRLR